MARKVQADWNEFAFNKWEWEGAPEGTQYEVSLDQYGYTATLWTDDGHGWEGEVNGFYDSLEEAQLSFFQYTSEEEDSTPEDPSPVSPSEESEESEEEVREFRSHLLTQSQQWDGPKSLHKSSQSTSLEKSSRSVKDMFQWVVDPSWAQDEFPPGTAFPEPTEDWLAETFSDTGELYVVFADGSWALYIHTSRGPMSDEYTDKEGLESSFEAAKAKVEELIVQEYQPRWDDLQADRLGEDLFL